MMAQKLMSENKDNPFNSRFFQPSDAMAAPQSQGFRNLMSRMETRDKQGTGANLYAGGAIASGFTPGAGVSDVLGYAPDPFNPGQTLPSFSENIDQGRYLDAGLQTVGAGGDVMLAASPFMPLLLAPAAAMKMTSQLGKALRSGSKATKSLDNAGEVAKVVPPTDKTDGIFAFHGSGADFDEFSLSKIDTGEGNQAFGYGLYFTESKDIAKFYKNALSDDMTAESRFAFKGNEYERGSPEWKMLATVYNEGISSGKKLLNTFKSDLAKGEPYITADKVKRYEAIINQSPKKSEITKKQGRIYDVKINAVMDDLVDYDKPLSLQKEILDKIEKTHGDPEIIATQLGLDFKKASGGDFLTALEGLGASNKKNASQWLTKSGIKGIRYLDNSARNTFGGKILSIDKMSDGFKGKVVLDDPNRQTGLGGSGRTITTSKTYKTEKEAKEWADKAIGKATNNYVIFDDKIIDIMAKYGIVGAVGVTAMQGASGGTEGDILPPGNI